MHVPLLDLQAQFAGIRDEVLSAVVRVCDSQRFVMGAEVEAFEHEIAELLGVKHAIGVSSGTDALLVSLMALGVRTGRRGRDEHVLVLRHRRRSGASRRDPGLRGHRPRHLQHRCRARSPAR